MAGLKLERNSQISINTTATVMAVRQQDHLVSFPDIDRMKENWINQFIVFQRTLQPSPEKTKGQTSATPPQAKGTPAIEQILVKDLATLNEILMNELHQRFLFLRMPTKRKQGDAVQIRLQIPLGLKAQANVHGPLIFSGRVFRTTQGRMAVRLNEQANSAITAVKRILGTVGKQKLDRDITRHSHIEHNTEFRRYIQLSLIAALLIACLVWAYFGVLQPKL